VKILFIVDQQFDIAFSSFKWIEVIKYLQMRHDVNLFAKYKNKKIQFKGLKNEICYFRSSKIPYITRIISYRDQLKKYNQIINKYFPDVILFNTQNLLLIKKAIKMKQKYKHRLILDIRSLLVSPYNIRRLIDEFFFRKTLKMASSRFDGITYITEEMKNFCTKKYDLKEYKSCIWSSGVNTNLFIPIDKINKENDDIIRIIYHGSIAPNRGIQNVVKALILLRSENIHLSILGAGKGINKLEKLIKLNGLLKTVKILNPVPYENVPFIINKYDIGILPFPNWPGWNTSSPIKLFEYLACGLPVIVTKIPAHINVLKDKNFVIWADSAEPINIANAIMLANKKRKELTKLGKEARNFIIDNYTWEKQAKKLESFFQNI